LHCVAAKTDIFSLAGMVVLACWDMEMCRLPHRITFNAASLLIK
jgi:hypothetical protein